MLNKGALYKKMHILIYWILKFWPNKRAIIFMGLKRNGNHAIINWIIGQADSLVCFYNAVGIQKSPFRGNMEFHYRRFFGSIFNRFCKHTANLIISYEDQFIKEIRSKRNSNSIHKFFPRTRNNIEIVILRDPFNFFASKINLRNWEKRMTDDESLIEFHQKLWISYAEEFLTLSDNPNRILINYNKWVIDTDYRKTLAEQLGFKFSDAGKNTVALYGDGSSLQKTTNASDLKVFERWQTMKNHPFFQKFILNDRILELSHQIFGPITGVNSFLEEIGYKR